MTRTQKRSTLNLLLYSVYGATGDPEAKDLFHNISVLNLILLWNSIYNEWPMVNVYNTENKTLFYGPLRNLKSSTEEQSNFNKIMEPYRVKNFSVEYLELQNEPETLNILVKEKQQFDDLNELDVDALYEKVNQLNNELGHIYYRHHGDGIQGLIHNLDCINEYEDYLDRIDAGLVLLRRSGIPDKYEDKDIANYFAHLENIQGQVDGYRGWMIQSRMHLRKEDQNGTHNDG